MRYFITIFLFISIALVSILGFRGSKSRKPPLEIFPDMDRQYKFLPQTANPHFSDGRADRPVVPGSVEFGSYVRDEFYNTGKIRGQFGHGFPSPIYVNREFMDLGQKKYNITCAVCHGQTGDGNGITKSYGMVATPTYHDDRMRKMTNGEIFDTISNGKNNMGAYKSKLSIKERWAVMTYLRALQRAHNPKPDDISSEKRMELGL